jgi:hypothetical protein
MKRNLFLIILLLSAGIGFSQSEKTIVSSSGFTNTENLIDGTSAFCYQYTGTTAEIVVKIDISYITSFTIDLRDNYASHVKFYVSPDNSAYNYIGEVYDDFGEFTFNVNKYASYIKIVTDRGPGDIDLIELTELYVSGTQSKVYFTYDDAGNRIARELIVSGIADLKNTPGGQPQKFNLGGGTDILLYPNPTSGLLNFEIVGTDIGDSPKVSIKIFSISGSLVHEEDRQSGTFTIDLTNKQNGTYLLDVNVNGKARHFTVIKQ